ncbi:MAG: peptidylprolyl isomerase [Actinomycetota bacterium]|nr:peptidylprolyl isomerase [Acidimicrobiia bacterium]MDQ3293482.1 peptidylprolyl isomerase [Actinomycetota bacterium]
MRPVRPIALLAVAVALLGAACGGGTTPPAAVVNGVEITQQAVVDELEAIGANEAYLQGYEEQVAAVVGAEEGTFDSAFVNETLALQVQYQLVLNAVDERGIASDEGCRQAARDQAISRLGPLSPTGDGAAIFEAFDAEYRETLVTREAAVLALQGDLVGRPCVDPDAVEAYYEENREQFEVETACTSHILLASEAEAEDVAGLLEDGADFAETAQARSTDPSAAENGGDLGCLTQADGIVPEFLEAAFTQPVGEVGPPVQTEFGFHLILVSSREVPTFEEIEEQVAQALADEVQAAFGTFFQGEVDAAVIDIDDRYGTWNPTNGSIDRPAIEATGDPTTVPVAPAG